MSTDEFNLWDTSNLVLNATADRAKAVCDDCLRAFSDEMRTEGRCDGEPGGDEAVDREPVGKFGRNTEHRKEGNRLAAQRRRDTVRSILAKWEMG